MPLFSFHSRCCGGTNEHVFEIGGDLSQVDDDGLSVLLREASVEVDRAEARRLAIAAEWDRRQAWALDGAYSGRCWMAAQCTVSGRKAHTILKTARVVASAPVIADAVADGRLPVARAEALTSVVTARTSGAFVRDQQILLDAVATLAVDEASKLARWWQQRADQDGAEPQDTQGRLRCTVAGDGTTHLAGSLGVEEGAVFRNMLEGIADQLWRASRDPNGPEKRPATNNAALRAEALVEMARRAGAADPNRTGARPSVTVLLDLDTLEARAGHPVEVDDAGLVTAEAARRLACDADISRLLTGPDGSLVDLGRTTRTATADQWRLLRLRDRGCTWPGCDRPPGWCQAHHIVWWEHGGLTHIDNMTLLCNHHHHQVHDRGWVLERTGDGGLQLTAPDGRTLIRPPPPPLRPLPPKPVTDPLDVAAIRARARALAAA